MAELGHTKRLSIYKLLVRAGPNGLAVGDIGQKLKIPGSTLSHHIKRLMQVGLVEQEPVKQILYCKPVYQQLDKLIQFLNKECCQDQICN